MMPSSAHPSHEARWLSRLEQANIRNAVISHGITGIIQGIVPFVPVLVVRLGGSAFLVSLLTASTSLSLILLAAPTAQRLARPGPCESSRDGEARQRAAVSALVNHRLAYHLLVAAIGPVSILAGPYAPVTIVALWACASVVVVTTNVALPPVMASVVTEGQVAALVSWRWTAAAVTSAMAAFTVGRLLDSVGFPAGYALAFSACAAVALVSFFFERQLRPLPRRESPPPQSEAPPSVWSTLRLPAVWHYATSLAVLRTGLALPAALVPIYWVKDVGVSDAGAGGIITGQRVAIIIGYLVWGWLVTHISSRPVLILSASGLAFYFATLGLARTPEALFLVTLLNGFFLSGLDIALFDVMVHAVPHQHRPHISAINQITSNIPGAFAPVLGVSLATLVGHGGVFALSASILIGGTGLAWALRVGHRNGHPHPLLAGDH